MNRLFMIAKNNMKKQRGDMITFFLLTMIAVFLVFDSVSALAGAKNVIKDRFTEIKGTDTLFAVDDSKESMECLEKALEKNGVIEYEHTPFLLMNADYKNKKDKDYTSSQMIAENYNNKNKFCDVVSDFSNLKKDDVIIPLYMKNAFAIGDTLQIKIRDDVYDLRVAGYHETPYFCSTLMISIGYYYVSDEMMEAFSEHATGNVSADVLEEQLYKANFQSVPGSDEKDLEKIEMAVADEFNVLISPVKEADPMARNNLDLTANWSLFEWGDMMLPSMVLGIILLFAVITLVIALVITSFSIKNFIQRNMKNTGILEASGYTVKELRWALTIQLLFVTVLGIIFGEILAFLSVGSFGSLLDMLIGISWNQPINVVVAIGTAFFFLVTIFITVRLLSRRYKKIAVLDALRGGISNHNFKKNFFSFEKTPMPTPLVLSLKDTFGGIGRNIAMSVIIAILTIVSLVGVGSVENFSNDPEGLIGIMGFEFGDMGVTGESGYADEMRELSGVKNVLVENSIEPTYSYKGMTSKIYTIVNDDGKYAINKVMIEGRFPENDNEVMLTGSVATELGCKVGDVITAKIGDKKEDYIVTGINQRLMQAGKTATMLKSGAKRLGANMPYDNYYVTAEDGVSYDELKKTFEDYAEKENLDFSYSKMDDMISSVTDTLTVTISAVCVLLSIITVLIVIFVESLVIRAKVTREWRGMGISKALGMSSGELLTQIMLSNIPAIIVGCVIGALLSSQAGKAVVEMAFSYMGVQNVHFNISFIWMVVVFVGIVLVAMMTSGLAGRKVKKINPIEMITEE